LDLYFDVIPKDKVEEMAQNNYDWIPIPSAIPSAIPSGNPSAIPSGIPSSFNEKPTNSDSISQTQMEITDEIEPETKMDVVCD
jgi:hypothetical protein